MSETIVERHAKEHVAKYLQSNPDSAPVYYKQLDGMNKGIYGSEQDMFIQKWDRFPFDIVDAFYFASVRTQYLKGKIGVAVLNVGAEPMKDKHVEENNTALKSLSNQQRLGISGIAASYVDVPENCIQASFWGGTQDEDGVVKVASGIPFMFQDYMPSGTWTDDPSVDYKMLSGNFKLEVGYCSAAKVWHTLQLCGSIARWPYGHEDMYLFYLDPKHRKHSIL